jgi:hypothetical protein
VSTFHKVPRLALFTSRTGDELRLHKRRTHVHDAIRLRQLASEVPAYGAADRRGGSVAEPQAVLGLKVAVLSVRLFRAGVPRLRRIKAIEQKGLVAR